MDTIRRRIFPLNFLLFTLLSHSAIAQQQSAPPSPPAPFKAEDPELYFAFFQAHASFANNVLAASPGTAAQMNSAAAALYQISPNDLPNLTAEVNKFAAALAVWQGPEQAYVAKMRAAKQLPDMKTMVTFQLQRQALVIAAHAGVRAAISPASWAGLHS